MKKQFYLASLTLAAMLCVGNAQAQVPSTTVTLANGATLDFLVGYNPQTSGVYLESASGTDGLDIVIPDSVEYNGVRYPVSTVSAYAFDGEGLRSVVVPDGVDYIEWWAFSDCTSLEEITVGKGLTDIGESAFLGCTSLQTIHWNAENCQVYELDGSDVWTDENHIHTIYFGSDVQSLGSGLFDNLTELDNIVVLADRVISATSASFWNSNTSATLTVLCSQSDAYLTDAFWGSFGSQADTCLDQQDTNYTPEPVVMHTLTLQSSQPQMGTAWGGCTFRGDTTVVIYATPNVGYAFGGWSDGETDNPRSITLNTDSTIAAEFMAMGDEPIVIEIHDTVFNVVHDTIVVTEMVHDTIIEYVHDTIYVDLSGVEAPNAEGTITIATQGLRLTVSGNIEGMDVAIYDAIGRHMHTLRATTDHLEMQLPSAGVYFVAVGKMPARKVVAY